MENSNDKSYKIITSNGKGEIEEKKSRFIGEAFFVKSQEEAVSIIEKVTKENYDARHVCYAYVIGDRSETVKCSDNGEPQGTAGKPILEVINGYGLTNILVTVTRYFGGTLLGTGGLVRAYTASGKLAIENSEKAIMTYGVKLSFSIDYSLVDKIMHTFENMGIELQNPIYGADVTYDIIVSMSNLDTVKNKITELSSGKATITIGESGYYPIPTTSL